MLRVERQAMVTMVCPSCHERFRYDGRRELDETQVLETSAVADGPPLTFRCGDQVVHSCPVNPA